MYFIFFFFSSRRRHTRCSRDWSSDVCSSDLLKGTSTERQPSAPTPGGAGSTANAEQTAKPSGPSSGGSESGGAGGIGRPGGGGTADLQQMINRMPAATLADLQKGDAVMVVATQGGANGG